MFRVRNEYLVVVAIGLLGVFMDITYLIVVNFCSSLDLRSILYEKGLYICFVAGVKFCSVF